MTKARFQALVDLHGQREAQARQALGRAEVARAHVVDVIREVEGQRDAAASQTDPRLRAVYIAFRARIDAELARLANDLRARDGEVEAARQALIAAHRDHAVFTRLRDRDVAARAVERERRAARGVDDFAAVRAFLTGRVDT